MSQEKKIKYLPGDILVTPDNSGWEGDIIFLEHGHDGSYMSVRIKKTDELLFLPMNFVIKHYINPSHISRTRDEKIDILLLEVDILS